MALIDMPLTVAFDADGFYPQQLAQALETKTITLRLDTATAAVALTIADHYPPRPDAVWMPINDLIDCLSPRAYNRMRDRVMYSPSAYYVDEAEGERLQASLDANPTAYLFAMRRMGEVA